MIMLQIFNRTKLLLRLSKLLDKSINNGKLAKKDTMIDPDS